MDTLNEKLLRSKAVVTSQMEADVRRMCNANDWQAIQGVYYRDLKHAKYRELDVSATQRWKFVTKDNLGQNPSITINILAEVKTMSGYHLVFDNLDIKPFLCFQSSVYCDWVGYIENHHKQRMHEIFSYQGIDKNDFPSLIDKISAIAYPEDTVRISELLIQPSQAKFFAGSFRETNIGSEKELENSVLWKACQSLWSSIESFIDDNFEDFFGDLDTNALLARQENDDTWFEQAIGNHSSSASLFHPVIVTSAKLWRLSSSGKALEEIPSTRLFIQDQRGHVIRWFDVVNFDAFDDWISDVTNQYYETLTQVNAVRDD